MCSRFSKKTNLSNTRYAVGQKYCKVCAEWIVWEGGVTKSWSWRVRGFIDQFISNMRCPCCGSRTRNNSRNIKLKNKNKEKMGMRVWWS